MCPSLRRACGRSHSTRLGTPEANGPDVGRVSMAQAPRGWSRSVKLLGMSQRHRPGSHVLSVGVGQSKEAAYTLTNTSLFPCVLEAIGFGEE